MSTTNRARKSGCGACIRNAFCLLKPSTSRETAECDKKLLATNGDSSAANHHEAMISCVRHQPSPTHDDVSTAAAIQLK
ncbi:unnamed protein product [Caenorhabditis bovis]|uniref:Uncharacterized protein n=1 Tax=Caenorhabditis bovis TaxID=2654633 RepID=A0A8S1F4L2_9PELO|nr:unnamed protein product [Caenorhabditis bovis]